MRNLIQDNAKIKTPNYHHWFGSSEDAETNEDKSTLVKDQDTMVSMIVLLLACLALAALAQVVI
jgi:hypothetical protein